ncbi:ABC transporter substrate-binding protein [Streptomyces calidiresistens]|uniref:ABC-type glycine betaine transport system substrate-binding domain-containing protein n=1 Tax=Streptomyces calidiresistens TaxID=1485586 RepID=A0A7W3XVG6_9ACTN|nr:glycine betaine ABC transporter substrate-binding protein [Streptomyces calidiresistens]MBB0228756.1 hypothetical protein [Streptomyces calidiresistens]
MDARPRARRLPITAVCVTVLLPLGACHSEPAAAGGYEEVVIALPRWPGGQANAAVAAHVLREEFGVPVVLRELDQGRAWDLMDTGEVHAVLEDWGALPDRTELYTGPRGSVVDAGELGPVGGVGWYVPASWARAHPGAPTPEWLADLTDELTVPPGAATDDAAPEADPEAVGGSDDGEGAGGALVYGHPDDVTELDERLIEDLDLDLTPVPLGGEDQVVAALRAAAAKGDGLLAAWWEPHWLNAEVRLVEIDLPPHTEGCEETDPSRTGEPCGYPEITLRKYLNADFAENGGAAAAFLARFSWTAREQNEVARMIAAEGMTPEGAAARWVEAHPGRVTSWLRDDGEGDAGPEEASAGGSGTAGRAAGAPPR